MDPLLRSAFLAILALAAIVPVASALGIAGVNLNVDPPVAAPRVAIPEVPLETSGIRVAAPPAAVALPRIDITGPIAGIPVVSGLGHAPDPAPSAPATPDPLPAAAPAAVGATLLYILASRFGLGRLAAALYSRLAPSELLENERRDKIIGLVRATPGIGPQAIAEALGTSWGVTSYHLEKLERAQLILSERSGHHRCYYLPGAVPREARDAVAMFRVETTRRVAKLVSESPGLTQSQVATALGLSASAMSKQVSRLEAAALVRREASADGNRLFPEPALAPVLA